LALFLSEKCLRFFFPWWFFFLLEAARRAAFGFCFLKNSGFFFLGFFFSRRKISLGFFFMLGNSLAFFRSAFVLFWLVYCVSLSGSRLVRACGAMFFNGIFRCLGRLAFLPRLNRLVEPRFRLKNWKIGKNPFKKEKSGFRRSFAFYSVLTFATMS